MTTACPCCHSPSAVTRFARATGDLHSLSAVDIKLVALAYTLEAATYGTTHLRVRLKRRYTTCSYSCHIAKRPSLLWSAPGLGLQQMSAMPQETRHSSPPCSS